MLVVNADQLLLMGETKPSPYLSLVENLHRCDSCSSGAGPGGSRTTLCAACWLGIGRKGADLARLADPKCCDSWGQTVVVEPFGLAIEVAIVGQSIG